MNRIGALVITYNEERSIEECLRSLDFCDERVVVDSFSDDATVRLAEPLADRIYQRPFHSYGEQKNWGLLQLTTPWVLILDADERVPPQLAEEILARAENDEHDGLWIRRRNFFFGRPIRGAGWGNDKVLRLFRRGRGRYDDRSVHEEVEMDAGTRVATCRHRLDHYSYVDWETTFRRLSSYSTRGARDLHARGSKAGAFRLLMSPTLRFFKQYVLRGGFRDGAHGLVLCGLSATGTFLRLAKLRLGEIEIEGAQGADSREVVAVKGELINAAATTAGLGQGGEEGGNS